MKGSKWKRWMAAICTAVMIAGVPVMGYATETSLTDSDANKSGDTTVNAEVVENDNSPTYEVVIPMKVDFGQIKQPSTEADDYVSTTMTVKCYKAENLQSSEVVAILVKDSTASDERSPFMLRNLTGGELQYEIYDSNEHELHDNTWYPNGFMVAAFSGGGQEKTLTLRLNRAQLYGKDLTTWGGAYEGTLNFYTRIAGVGDVVHSMADADLTDLEPVVW